MDDAVRDSYDAMAERYAAFVRGDLDRATGDRDWLAAFAELAASNDGAIADLGCGPGHVVNHLTEFGLTATGYDLSPGQISEARKAFPDLQFHVGDLAALDIADASSGGIVSRYSLIHTLPDRFDHIFREWIRVLEPGAPVLISFFASSSPEAHGTSFDHAVVTAYALFPATVAKQLEDAGFSDIKIDTRRPLEGERELDHGTILAQKPSN